MEGRRVTWFGAAVVSVAIAAAQDRSGDTRVAGIAQRDDNGPLEGTRVSLTALAHPELPPSVAWALGPQAHLTVECTTDGKGVFKVGLPHAGPFTVIAVSADGKRTGHRFPVMASDFVTLTLRPSSVVTGKVLDTNGQIVANACVTSMNYSGTGISRERHAWWHPPFVGTTDEQGSFRMEFSSGDPEFPALGTRGLRAASSSHSVWERLYRLDGQSLSDVVLKLRAPRRIDGRVVSAADGKPIANAEIRDVEEADRLARTDADGRFTLDNEYAAALLVRAPGHAVQTFTSDNEQAAALLRAAGQAVQTSSAEKAVCALNPGVTVRARLLKAGSAVSSQRILLASRDTQTPFHFAWRASTDAEGKLEVTEARVGQLLHGFVEVEGRFVSFMRIVPRATQVDLGDVTVDDRRTVTGTVLGHDGLRRAGAMVMLQPVIEAGETAPTSYGLLPRVLTRITYTDRAGRFRFDCVPRIPHRIAISAGFEGFRDLPLDADKNACDVRLGAGDEASGIVRLPDGTPAADACVQYLPMLEADHALFGAMPYLLGRTDGEGRFHVRGLAPHASFTIWAMCAREGAGFIASHAAPSAQNDGCEIVLRPHDGRL